MVLSLYLYLSSFSFSSCTFFAIITSSFSPFQIFILWGKLIFCIVQANSILQFFLVPSTFKPLLFVSMLGLFYLFPQGYLPLSLLSFSVVRCISFNLSSYVRSSNYGTILVAILCILSNFNICFFVCGNHITSAYSSFYLIIVVIIFLLISLSRKLKPIHIFLSILNMSPNILSICFSGDKLSCITTPKFFSSFAIDMIFSPNFYIHEGLIALFSFSNTWHFFALNSISHVLLIHISCLYNSVAPHNPWSFYLA